MQTLIIGAVAVLVGVVLGSVLRAVSEKAEKLQFQQRAH